jgi:hypothetical protein
MHSLAGRLWFLRAVVAALLATGCSNQSARGNAVPASVADQTGGVTRAFIDALASQDSAALSRVSAESTSSAWFRRFASQYQGFLAAANDSLEILHAYFGPTPGQEDTVIVVTAVPYRTCPPPAHSQTDTEVSFQLVKRGSQWLVAKAWTDPC